MSNSIVLGGGKEIKSPTNSTISSSNKNGLRRPQAADYSVLQENLNHASQLVDDIVLKKYLYTLNKLEVIPLDNSLKNITDIRLFRITEMVYQSNEYSTYKFASVFNAVQNLNCGVFIVVDSDGSKTEFYMGVRSLDNTRTTKSLKDTLRNALLGQFPGVKTKDLMDPEAEAFLRSFPSKNIASVSCVAKNKDKNFNNNESFLQGFEKLTLAMQGQRYTAVILAKSTSSEQLLATRNAYEAIYTQLSPFAKMNVSYGTNTSLSISNAFSHSSSIGTSDGTSEGTSYGKSKTKSQSEGKNKYSGIKALGSIAVSLASLITAPISGVTSFAVAGVLNTANNAFNAMGNKSETNGTSTSNSSSTQRSTSHSTQNTESNTRSNTETNGSGTSDNVQLTIQNKSLEDTLKKIDEQLNRIDECESIGMWECAAYFLADNQETAEMAAGTYKALMKGEHSGIEASAINCWDKKYAKQLPLLREYITNFIHPMFAYEKNGFTTEVTSSSLVSSNELAIHMGLPRKSVCGFPVIEHADFGKEVVTFEEKRKARTFPLGKIFSMGTVTHTKVNLDCDSLTMHTFVTGSTGSGKSNTVYELLNQIRLLYKIPFLVIEPAKGEYKNVFGQFADVHVYGTNPKKSNLLRLNPFKFTSDIHILEHVDRLIEIFGACWSMEAAMPQVLKDAMIKAYASVGWNLELSTNPRGEQYPNFLDLLEQLEKVIDESAYSSDCKGDYKGALSTRISSLTNGLNSLIFTRNDLSDQDLFDKNVIVDLSRVGSAETKSLIMGLLIMKLNEYRMSSGNINSPLSHITVLEEAHNILRRTSTEQSADSSNVLGKSVEMLSNSIAEMRTYGEGFIIADQSPGMLDMSVIRNTNTKIILRLPDKDDRELVGSAAGLNKEQIAELSKLKRGVAAVYQNNWVEPILVQVNKCTLQEGIYNFNGKVENMNPLSIKTQVMNLMIQGRVKGKLHFSVREIENGLNYLHLSSNNCAFIEELIEEYCDTNRLEIWDKENYDKLCKKITDILGVRTRVFDYICSSIDDSLGEDALDSSYFKNISKMLKKVIDESTNFVSNDVTLEISKCIMRDMSLQKGEDSDIRVLIYQNWLCLGN